MYHPEMRLRLIWVPSATMVSGIFVYGLTIAEICTPTIKDVWTLTVSGQGRPWIINAIGAALMGFGLGGVGDPLIGYL